MQSRSEPIPESADAAFVLENEPAGRTQKNLEFVPDDAGRNEFDSSACQLSPEALAQLLPASQFHHSFSNCCRVSTANR